MATISQAFAIAMQHCQAGRLEHAEQIFRQIVTVAPHDFNAWHFLGVVYGQLGRHQSGVECIQRALAVNPHSAAAHYNLGVILQNQGQLAGAVSSYQRSLQIKSDDVDTLIRLAIVLQNLGQRAPAIDCYRRVLQLKPDDAQVHSNLGNALKDDGRIPEAIACYQRAVQLKPDLAEAHANLGNAWKEQRRIPEAIACYQRAVQLRPDLAEVHANLGNALKEQRRIPEAITCYQCALQQKPDLAETHNNLGNAWKDLRCIPEAIACYEQALRLRPELAEVYMNLGNALKEQRRIPQAIACYERALQRKPDLADAHKNLGNALKEQRRIPEAIACYGRAWQLNPRDIAAASELCLQLQHICLWDELRHPSQVVVSAVDSARVGDLAEPPSPFSFLTLSTPTTAEQQLRCARLWAGQQWESMSVSEAALHAASTRPTRSRITVGYLSGDFHEHATAYLTAELFERHDRDRFTVIGYSYGPDDRSPMRQRLMHAFDRFVDLQDTSYLEAAKRITADEVDILVDLKGYTERTRTEILAHRPAPIQVNYLGYPGTMGAPFMDYILVDEFVVPADQQPFYSERLVHLPGCYQVNDGRREISRHTPSKEACGLPQEGFVFCCFNNSYKITPEVFSVWMELLRDVPGSVLWLLEGNPFVSVNLRREAEARGIPGERLVFAPRLPLAEHLARHRLADLFLDTFPVNAHTTTSDALWAGLPALSMAGHTFVSRVAGSLLRTIGLPELVTTNLDEYHVLALRLAREPDVLAEVRARLQGNCATSSLFDAERFARNIEQALVAMWEIHLAGQKPHAFAVS